jgi:hypothetical protein
VQEILDTAEPAGAGADALDQAGGAGVDACLGCRRARRGAQEARRDLLIRRRVGRLQEGRRPGMSAAMRRSG